MNQFYAHARQRATDAGLQWPSGNIKAALVTAAYTPDIVNDNFLSTISGISGAILSRSANFTTKTNTGGILNADPITFSLVASGSVGKYVVIYRDTGSDSTSELIAIDDTGQNLPVTTNGQDITVQWSSGTNKIGQI